MALLPYIHSKEYEEESYSMSRTGYKVLQKNLKNIIITIVICKKNNNINRIKYESRRNWWNWTHWIEAY
jgi:hypothetical protein